MNRGFSYGFTAAAPAAAQAEATATPTSAVPAPVPSSPASNLPTPTGLCYFVTSQPPGCARCCVSLYFISLRVRTLVVARPNSLLFLHPSSSSNGSSSSKRQGSSKKSNVSSSHSKNSSSNNSQSNRSGLSIQKSNNSHNNNSSCGSSDCYYYSSRDSSNSSSNGGQEALFETTTTTESQEMLLTAEKASLDGSESRRNNGYRRRRRRRSTSSSSSEHSQHHKGVSGSPSTASLPREAADFFEGSSSSSSSSSSAFRQQQQKQLPQQLANPAAAIPANETEGQDSVIIENAVSAEEGEEWPRGWGSDDEQLNPVVVPLFADVCCMAAVPRSSRRCILHAPSLVRLRKRRNAARNMRQQQGHRKQERFFERDGGLDEESDAFSDISGEKLQQPTQQELEDELELYRAAHLEDLVLLTNQQLLLLLRYDEEPRTVATIASLDLSEAAGRPVAGGPLLAVCPYTSCIAVYQYEALLQYIPLNASRSPLSPSAANRLLRRRRCQKYSEEEHSTTITTKSARKASSVGESQFVAAVTSSRSSSPTTTATSKPPSLLLHHPAAFSTTTFFFWSKQLYRLDEHNVVDICFLPPPNTAAEKTAATCPACCTHCFDVCESTTKTNSDDSIHLLTTALFCSKNPSPKTTITTSPPFDFPTPLPLSSSSSKTMTFSNHTKNPTTKNKQITTNHISTQTQAKKTNRNTSTTSNTNHNNSSSKAIPPFCSSSNSNSTSTHITSCSSNSNSTNNSSSNLHSIGSSSIDKSSSNSCSSNSSSSSSSSSSNSSSSSSSSSSNSSSSSSSSSNNSSSSSSNSSSSSSSMNLHSISSSSNSNSSSSSSSNLNSIGSNSNSSRSNLNSSGNNSNSRNSSHSSQDVTVVVGSTKVRKEGEFMLKGCSLEKKSEEEKEKEEEDAAAGGSSSWRGAGQRSSESCWSTFSCRTKSGTNVVEGGAQSAQKQHLQGLHQQEHGRVGEVREADKKEEIAVTVASSHHKTPNTTTTCYNYNNTSSSSSIGVGNGGRRSGSEAVVGTKLWATTAEGMRASSSSSSAGLVSAVVGMQQRQRNNKNKESDTESQGSADSNRRRSKKREKTRGVVAALKDKYEMEEFPVSCCCCEARIEEGEGVPPGCSATTTTERRGGWGGGRESAHLCVLYEAAVGVVASSGSCLHRMQRCVRCVKLPLGVVVDAAARYSSAAAGGGFAQTANTLKHCDTMRRSSSSSRNYYYTNTKREHISELLPEPLPVKACSSRLLVPSPPRRHPVVLAAAAAFSRRSSATPTAATEHPHHHQRRRTTTRRSSPKVFDGLLVLGVEEILYVPLQHQQQQQLLLQPPQQQQPQRAVCVRHRGMPPGVSEIAQIDQVSDDHYNNNSSSDSSSSSSGSSSEESEDEAAPAVTALTRGTAKYTPGAGQYVAPVSPYCLAVSGPPTTAAVVQRKNGPRTSRRRRRRRWVFFLADVTGQVYLLVVHAHAEQQLLPPLTAGLEEQTPQIQQREQEVDMESDNVSFSWWANASTDSTPGDMLLVGDRSSVFSSTAPLNVHSERKKGSYVPRLLASAGLNSSVSASADSPAANNLFAKLSRGKRAINGIVSFSSSDGCVLEEEGCSKKSQNKSNKGHWSVYTLDWLSVEWVGRACEPTGIAVAGGGVFLIASASSDTLLLRMLDIGMKKSRRHQITDSFNGSKYSRDNSSSSNELSKSSLLSKGGGQQGGDLIEGQPQRLCNSSSTITPEEEDFCDTQQQQQKLSPLFSEERVEDLNAASSYHRNSAFFYGGGAHAADVLLPTTGRLQVLQAFPNLGPIIDCCTADVEGNGQKVLIVACGHGRSSCLRFLRSGLALHAACAGIPLKAPLRGLFTLNITAAAEAVAAGAAAAFSAAAVSPHAAAAISALLQQPQQMKHRRLHAAASHSPSAAAAAALFWRLPASGKNKRRRIEDVIAILCFPGQTRILQWSRRTRFSAKTSPTAEKKSGECGGGADDAEMRDVSVKSGFVNPSSGLNNSSIHKNPKLLGQLSGKNGENRVLSVSAAERNEGVEEVVLTDVVCVRKNRDFNNSSVVTTEKNFGFDLSNTTLLCGLIHIKGAAPVLVSHALLTAAATAATTSAAAAAALEEVAVMQQQQQQSQGGGCAWLILQVTACGLRLIDPLHFQLLQSIPFTFFSPFFFHRPSFSNQPQIQQQSTAVHDYKQQGLAEQQNLQEQHAASQLEKEEVLFAALISPVSCLGAATTTRQAAATVENFKGSNKDRKKCCNCHIGSAKRVCLGGDLLLLGLAEGGLVVLSIHVGTSAAMSLDFNNNSSATGGSCNMVQFSHRVLGTLRLSGGSEIAALHAASLDSLVLFDAADSSTLCGTNNSSDPKSSNVEEDVFEDVGLAVVADIDDGLVRLFALPSLRQVACTGAYSAAEEETGTRVTSVLLTTLERVVFLLVGLSDGRLVSSILTLYVSHTDGGLRRLEEVKLQQRKLMHVGSEPVLLQPVYEGRSSPPQHSRRSTILPRLPPIGLHRGRLAGPAPLFSSAQTSPIMTPNSSSSSSSSSGAADGSKSCRSHAAVGAENGQSCIEEKNSSHSSKSRGSGDVYRSGSKSSSSCIRSVCGVDDGGGGFSTEAVVSDREELKKTEVSWGCVVDEVARIKNNSSGFSGPCCGVFCSGSRPMLLQASPTGHLLFNAIPSSGMAALGAFPSPYTDSQLGVIWVDQPAGPTTAAAAAAQKKAAMTADMVSAEVIESAATKAVPTNTSADSFSYSYDCMQSPRNAGRVGMHAAETPAASNVGQLGHASSSSSETDCWAFKKKQQLLQPQQQLQHREGQQQQHSNNKGGPSFFIATPNSAVLFGTEDLMMQLRVGVRERAQRLQVRALPIGRTVDALCAIETCNILVLACPREIVHPGGAIMPSCLLFIDPLTCSLEACYIIPAASHVAAAICLAPLATSHPALSSMNNKKRAAAANVRMQKRQQQRSSTSTTTTTTNAAAAVEQALPTSSSSHHKAAAPLLKDAADEIEQRVPTTRELLCVGTAEVIASDAEPKSGLIILLEVKRGTDGLLVVREAAHIQEVKAGVQQLQPFQGLLLAACNHRVRLYGLREESAEDVSGAVVEETPKKKAQIEEKKMAMTSLLGSKKSSSSSSEGTERRMDEAARAFNSSKKKNERSSLCALPRVFHGDDRQQSGHEVEEPALLASVNINSTSGGNYNNDSWGSVESQSFSIGTEASAVIGTGGCGDGVFESSASSRNGEEKKNGAKGGLSGGIVAGGGSASLASFLRKSCGAGALLRGRLELICSRSSNTYVAALQTCKDEYIFVGDLVSAAVLLRFSLAERCFKEIARDSRATWALAVSCLSPAVHYLADADQNIWLLRRSPFLGPTQLTSTTPSTTSATTTFTNPATTNTTTPFTTTTTLTTGATTSNTTTATTSNTTPATTSSNTATTSSTTTSTTTPIRTTTTTQQASSALPFPLAAAPPAVGENSHSNLCSSSNSNNSHSNSSHSNNSSSSLSGKGGGGVDCSSNSWMSRRMEDSATSSSGGGVVKGGAIFSGGIGSTTRGGGFLCEEELVCELCQSSRIFREGKNGDQSRSECPCQSVSVRLSPVAYMHLGISLNKIISFATHSPALLVQQQQHMQQLSEHAAFFSGKQYHTFRKSRAQSSSASGGAAAYSSLSKTALLPRSNSRAASSLAAIRDNSAAAAALAKSQHHQQPVLGELSKLWISAEGAVGLLMQLRNDAVFTRLTILQDAITTVTKSVGELGAAAFHSVKVGSACVPSKGFIDGNIVERLLELPPQTQRSVYEVALMNARLSEVELPPLDALIEEVEELQRRQ